MTEIIGKMGDKGQELHRIRDSWVEGWVPKTIPSLPKRSGFPRIWSMSMNLNIWIEIPKTKVKFWSIFRISTATWTQDLQTQWVKQKSETFLPTEYQVCRWETADHRTVWSLSTITKEECRSKATTTTVFWTTLPKASWERTKCRCPLLWWTPALPMAFLHPTRRSILRKAKEASETLGSDQAG